MARIITVPIVRITHKITQNKLKYSKGKGYRNDCKLPEKPFCLEIGEGNCVLGIEDFRDPSVSDLDLSYMFPEADCAIEISRGNDARGEKCALLTVHGDEMSCKIGAVELEEKVPFILIPGIIYDLVIRNEIYKIAYLKLGAYKECTR